MNRPGADYMGMWPHPPNPLDREMSNATRPSSTLDQEMSNATPPMDAEMFRNAAACLPHRDGATYDHARDARRLAGQHARVLALMRDGRPHTLAEISKHTRDPEASVSARIRDLRKERFGSHVIERKFVKGGLHTYRLIVGQLDLLA